MRLSHLHLLLLISLSLLFIGQRAQAQFLTADDFFHSGAQFYISNNIPAAKERVTMGRQLYPEDDKLKKLEQLLNQQQQSQSSQSQQQQQKDQQSQSQQSQSKDQKQQQQQQPKDQQSQAEKQKEQEAQKQAQKKQDEDKQKQAEEAKAAEKDKDNKDADTNEVADAKGAHQMTPKEAERLLDNQKDTEQYLTMKPKDKPEQAKRLIKDW